MSSSKGLELERLSREIDETGTWLRGARAVESFDLAATLEREMADKQNQKDKLLADIESDPLDEQRGSAPSVRGDSVQAPIPSILREAEPSEGIGRMWRLTPADVDRAKQAVERQRIEMLDRHAQEMQSLQAEGAELDGLEQAIDAFIRKFGANAAALREAS